MTGWVLGALLACRSNDVDEVPRDDDGSEHTAEPSSVSTAGTGFPRGHTGDPTGTPGPSPLEWVSAPTDVPAGGRSQDHATAALRPDGTGMVVYSDDERLRGVRVEPDGSLLPIDMATFTNHGQVAATPSGFVVVATFNSGTALFGATFDADAAPDREAVLLSETHVLLPDVSVHTHLDGTVRGIVAATDGLELGCTSFVDDLDALTPAPCPPPVDPRRATGSVAVVQTQMGPRYAWTEIATDRSLAVYVGDGIDAPVLVDALGHGGSMAGRPMIAAAGDDTEPTDDDVGVVVYRGAAAEGLPIGSYLWHARDNGVHTWRLGGNVDERDVERVAVSPIARDLYVVAWEEAGQLWLQARDVTDGGPEGPPVPAGTDPSREPRRPSLDLVVGDDGVVQGVVSWESAEAGSAVEADGRIVRVRRFLLADQP